MKPLKYLIIILCLTQFKVFAGPMSGDYTIGSTGNYANIIDAVNALSTNGVNGPCMFTIQPGSYPGQINFPSISGASSVNTIEFDGPGANVNYISTGNADNFILKLDGAEYIKFKGINFTSTSSDYNRIVHVDNGTNNVIFEDNNFTSPMESTKFGDSLAIVFIPAASPSVHDVVFTKNTFTGGAYGIHMESNAGTDRSHKISINENDFTNNSNSAIYIASIKELDISGNQFSEEQGHIIQLFGVDGQVVIRNNRMNAELMSGGSGINITNHNSTSNSDTCLIYNNIIELGAGTGISLSNSYHVYVLHNSVYTESINTYRPLYLHICDTLDIYNNLFINNGTSEAVYITSLANKMKMDHNNYYSTGTNKFQLNPEFYSSLTEWQSVTNLELNSFFSFPSFNNTNELELKCDVSQDLQSTFTLLPNLAPIDFLNRVRNSPPWMGAMELFVPNDNLVSVSGYIHNGIDTIKNGVVEAYGDTSNRAQLDLIGQVDIDPDGSYTFSGIPAVPMYLKIMANGSLYPDYLVSFHDSTIRAEDCIAIDPDDCNGIVHDIHPRKMANVIFDGDGVIKGNINIDNGGTNKTLGNDPIPGLDVVLDKIPPSKTVAITQTDINGDYSFSGLPNGVYVVSISYQGLPADTLYEVEVDGVDTLFEYLDYCIDSTENIAGCNPGLVSNNDVIAFEGKVYPNPFGHQILVEAEHNLDIIRIYDITGKQVMAKYPKASFANIDASKLNSGIYFISIESNGTKTTQRIIKR